MKKAVVLAPGQTCCLPTHACAVWVCCAVQELNFWEFSFDDDPDETLIETPGDYCAAWPLLPIYDVTVRGIVTPHVLESLAETTRLTTLLLQYDMDSSANISQLAAALKPLRQLQELDLAWKEDNLGVHWWPNEAKLGCLSALQEMSELSKLWLKGLPLPRAAAEVIGQLQQVTSLRLISCDVDDYCLNVIALKLTGGSCGGTALAATWVRVCAGACRQLLVYTAAHKLVVPCGALQHLK